MRTNIESALHLALNDFAAFAWPIKTKYSSPLSMMSQAVRSREFTPVSFSMLQLISSIYFRTGDKYNSLDGWSEVVSSLLKKQRGNRDDFNRRNFNIRNNLDYADALSDRISSRWWRYRRRPITIVTYLYRP